MDQENEFEQMEEHIHRNLGLYGLEFLNKFLQVKELAEDMGLCPPDTEERQEQFEQMHG
jgi:hypothetical protein